MFIVRGTKLQTMLYSSRRDQRIGNANPVGRGVAGQVGTGSPADFGRSGDRRGLSGARRPGPGRWAHPNRREAPSERGRATATEGARRSSESWSRTPSAQSV